MVVIRLSRGGTNKRPFYKVVATDSRVARDGACLEYLGYFNPIAAGGEKRLELKRERVTYWLSKGAQPSERVISLLREFDHPELLEKRKMKSVARKSRKRTEAKVQVESATNAEASAQEATSEST